MTSSLEKTREFENRVILKNSREFKNRMNLKIA